MRIGLTSIICACVLAATCVGCSTGEEPRTEAIAETPSSESTAPPEPAADSGPSVAQLRKVRRQGRERAVEGAVRDFYREVEFGAYESAWGRLTPAAQAQLGGYEGWRAGYDLSVSTRVSQVTAVEARRGFAVVVFKLRSEDIDECADTVVQRFAGRWELVRVGRHWRAESVGAEKIAGATPVTTIEDCPGYADDIQSLSSGGVPDYDLPDNDSYGDDSDPDYDYGDGYEDDYGAPTTEDFGSGQGTVGLCEDGTLSDSVGRQGACSHHGGVAE